jgi:hypothetical protein
MVSLGRSINAPLFIGASKRHSKFDKEDDPVEGMRHAFGRAIGALTEHLRKEAECQD